MGWLMRLAVTILAKRERSVTFRVGSVLEGLFHHGSNFYLSGYFKYDDAMLICTHGSTTLLPINTQDQLRREYEVEYQPEYQAGYQPEG